MPNAPSDICKLDTDKKNFHIATQESIV